MTRRVVVIGLDGATFDLISPWARAGLLPNLSRLMTEGSWGNLLSTFPPVTSPAWPSFMTGKLPPKHGIFDFIRQKGSGFEMVNDSHLAGRTLWEWLSAAGKRVGVLNVPVTYPPRPVNGFLVSGLLTPPHAERCYPAGFLQPYVARLGPFRSDPTVQYRPGNEAEFLDDLLDMTETTARYALTLMAEHPWDFFMVHFLASDVMEHAFFRFLDPNHPRYDPAAAAEHAPKALRLYQRLDQAIGDLLARLDDDTTLIVMSDHGQGPLYRIVNLNNLLLAAGLLHLKRDGWTQLRYALFRRGLTPAAVYRLISRLGLQNLVWRFSRGARNRVVDKFLSFQDVDWQRTLAYSLGHVGQIYINTADRGNGGPVKTEAERQAVIDQVIAALSRLRVPGSDRPLLERVIRREELGDGPFARQGPDLHLILDGYRCISFPLFASSHEIIAPQIRGDSGCHRLEGILLVRGPGVAAGQSLTGARIIDLAPTILYAMGLPVPDEMDGRVLTELWPGEGGAPVTFAAPAAPDRDETTGLTPEEEEQVRQRLEALGYL